MQFFTNKMTNKNTNTINNLCSAVQIGMLYDQKFNYFFAIENKKNKKGK